MSFYTRAPTVPVDVDGLRIGAPYSEALLDDLLDFWEVGLQGLVTEHFGKHLERHSQRKIYCHLKCDCTWIKINQDFSLNARKLYDLAHRHKS